MLFQFFRKRKTFNNADKLKFADAIAGMLEIQQIAAKHFNASIEDANGNPKCKAIGYVYGYIDAALRSQGHDMADLEIGVPITYQVIRRLWPEKAQDYMDFLIKNMKSNSVMALGMMHGGQQFIDYSKPDAPGSPMGLARFMSEE